MGFFWAPAGGAWPWPPRSRRTRSRFRQAFCCERWAGSRATNGLLGRRTSAPAATQQECSEAAGQKQRADAALTAYLMDGAAAVVFLRASRLGLGRSRWRTGRRDLVSALATGTVIRGGAIAVTDPAATGR